MGFDWRDYLASQKPKKDPPPDFHYWLELDPHEHDALHELVHGRDSGLSTTQTVTLRERLRDARRITGPRLVEARLDWDELEATASKQGCSAADVFFDRAKGK